MWHLKTTVGTFWILPGDSQTQCVLGLNNDILRSYTDPEEAVQDVQTHATGYLTWDQMDYARPIPTLEAWFQGEPEDWMV